jgi:hypothetical protein
MNEPAKHTPGPWIAELFGGVVASVNGVRRQVALATGDPSPATEPDLAVATRDANARLIAAAPGLLEALRGLVAGIERACAAGRDLDGYVGVGKALRALAKAEGRALEDNHEPATNSATNSATNPEGTRPFLLHLADMKAPRLSRHWACPECGPQRYTDEDGCCLACGRDCNPEAPRDVAKEPT